MIQWTVCGCIVSIATVENIKDPPNQEELYRRIKASLKQIHDVAFSAVVCEGDGVSHISVQIQQRV